MLSPIVSPAKTLQPIAYDLEWWPETYRLRLIGVLDESGYRHYETVEDFFTNELTDRNRGRIFFAHAGGSYDVQFILEQIAKNDRFSVSASFSGAAAVLCHIRKNRDKWTFADSYFLLRDSLKKVGKTIGLPKLDCAFDAPIGELVGYNERDCEIVFKGLWHLQNELQELGSELRPTLASCAMQLFRRVHLKQTIPTSAKINEVLRASYCASRVEVLAPRAAHAKYYDINSSFPFSMTQPQPGELLGIRPRPPKGERAIWFAKARVKVPEIDLPPLPYKRGMRIFFPTGEWEGWFTKVDLDLLEETGGSILSISQVYEYSPFDDLTSYVEELYARKNAADKAGDSFKRYTYKLLLNALYGKFGERTEKEAILIHPESTTCPHSQKHRGDSCMSIVSPGIWRVTELKHVPHAHVPIASYVTSLSRALLYRYLRDCNTRYYCDTDSVVCGTNDDLPTSDKLGDLKFEGEIEDAEFICAKVYAFTGECGECQGDGGACVPCKGTGKVRAVRSKGFRRLSPHDFEKLKNYQKVPIERTAGIREGLRSTGAFGMRKSEITEKKLNPLTVPKRAPDGAKTRPWSVEELERKKA